MLDQFQVVPTVDRPFRAIPVDVDQACVKGDYQVVLTLPDKPTKGQLLLAYAEACRSMAELAEKWASEEGIVVTQHLEGAKEQTYRICFNMNLRADRGRA